MYNLLRDGKINMRKLSLTEKCFFTLLPVFLAAFPLGAQDYSEEEDFFDEDILIMEDEGLTIVGTIETTQQIKTVTREDIEKSHAADLPGLLEETLGTGVTRYGPYGNMADVNIRGFDTERIAVLIDGIPVNSTRSGEFDFNSIDINSIEKIEVIYGGSDTKYNVSGALGGVINIITVKKQKPGWRIGGNFSNLSALPGRYNQQYGGIGEPQAQDLADAQNLGVFGGYAAEKFSVQGSIFGNRAGNHFLYQDDYGYARRKEGNEVWDIGGSASLVLDLPKLSKLIVSADVYYGDKNIPASGYTAEHAKQIDFSSRQNVMLQMPQIFRDDLAMDLSLGHNGAAVDYDPGLNPSSHNEQAITLVNRWNWYPLSELTLRLGGDFRYAYIDSTNDGIHNGFDGGLYLAAEYQPHRVVLLTSSIKGVTDGKQIVPVPKLGVSWQAADFLILKNNYFRSFKFPDFDDLYWVQAGFMGNPDLKPEDGWGADLMVEFRRKDWLELDSTFYTEWTKDSIHWSNASGAWHPENIGMGFFFGWDTDLKITLPFTIGPFEKPVVSLSYQLQLSWLLNEGLGFSDNIRIPYMPMHKCNISLDIPWTTKLKGYKGSLLISGQFEGQRYADTANITALDPHFLLNITVNQQINKNISAFAAVRNILNAHYTSFADYPMPGLTISIGMRVNYEGIGAK
jgi:vitamin B12 transporter